MMTKITKIFALMILLVVSMSMAYASVDASFSFTNANHVEARVYDCLNADCSEVTAFSGSYDQETYSGNLHVVFPTQVQNQGYAIYFAAPGKIPKIYKSDLGSTDDGMYYVNYDITFNQVTECQSVIDEFVVINDVYANEPLQIDVSSSLDARTASAFERAAGRPLYTPEEFKQRYFSSDVDVELEIFDSNGNVVKEDLREFNYENGNSIFMDEQMDVEFSWTPTQEGRYLAKVTSIVTDAQCASNVEASSEKDFSVLPSRPTNECYTLLNDLDVDKLHLTEGDTLSFSYKKLSNYANANHVKYPVETDVSYKIYLDGEEVYSHEDTLAANSNNYDFEEHSFSYVASDVGDLSVVITGIANSPICEMVDNTAEMLTFNAKVQEEDVKNIEFHISDSVTGMPIEGVSVYVEDMDVVYTNSMGVAIVEDVESGNYAFSSVKAGYASYSNVATVYDTTEEVFFLMVPTNPLVECSDGVDNDRNGYCDFDGCVVNGVQLPADPGCSSEDDDDESGYVVTNLIEFTSDMDEEAYVGINYDGQLEAVSENGVSLTYGLGYGPSNMEVSSDGIVSWVPLPQQLGNNRIVVYATDGNYFAEYAWEIEVMHENFRQSNSDYEQVSLMRIRLPAGEYVRAGETVELSVHMENEGDVDYDDSRMTVTIQDLGIRKTLGPFDLDDGDEVTKTVYLEIPEYAKDGEYVMRIKVGNDDFSRIKHKTIMIIWENLLLLNNK